MNTTNKSIAVGDLVSVTDLRDGTVVVPRTKVTRLVGGLATLAVGYSVHVKCLTKLEDKKAAMIDLTPSWVSLVPLFQEWIRRGKPSQKDLVCDELAKLARVADEYVKLQKEKITAEKVAETLAEKPLTADDKLYLAGPDEGMAFAAYYARCRKSDAAWEDYHDEFSKDVHNLSFDAWLYRDYEAHNNS